MNDLHQIAAAMAGKSGEVVQIDTGRAEELALVIPVVAGFKA
jgi:hypothetical protein